MHKHLFAAGLTGRTLLTEHLDWHAINVLGLEWAIDYLESATCDWAAEEIDFVDWVFATATVLRERTAWIALSERLTYPWTAEQRVPNAKKSPTFMNWITHHMFKKMVRRVMSRCADEIWPRSLEGFKRPTSARKGKV